MLSRWHATRAVLVFARIGGSWPGGLAPGGLMLLAQRWSASVASWLAGLVHLAARAHDGLHAFVVVVLWAFLFLLGVGLYRRSRNAI